MVGWNFYAQAREDAVAILELHLSDKGAVDEQDVKSVLVRHAGKLDNEYLTKRARQAEVLTILQTIQTNARIIVSISLL